MRPGRGRWDYRVDHQDPGVETLRAFWLWVPVLIGIVVRVTGLLVYLAIVAVVVMVRDGVGLTLVVLRESLMFFAGADVILLDSCTRLSGSMDAVSFVVGCHGLISSLAGSVSSEVVSGRQEN